MVIEMQNQDQKYIRVAIELAYRAREHGNHPFGAVLVGPDGDLLLEAENSVISDNDLTAHAEINLVRVASRKFDQDYLAQCTLYASTEPCPMCSGAIYWSNIRRLVYGLSQKRFYTLLGQDTSGDNMTLTCREVFVRGGRSVEVGGPLLEDQAERVHHGFWENK